MNRRTLLKNAVKMFAGLAVPPAALCYGESDSFSTIRRSNAPSIAIPADFIGFGYEMSSVAPLGLLSPANHRYVSLIKGLSAKGVLRVGGIVADYTKYDPDGTILAEPQNTVITRASLEQFAAFLKEIDWTAIWSVNFAQGSIKEAVDEARAVSAALGQHLLALEIGNEVENYSHGEHPFRKPPYDYETYRAEYSAWHDVIAKACPGIRFAAPDTAASVEWVERMAADAKGDVQLLTTHYYRNGQKHGSAEQLALPDPQLTDRLTRLRAASQKSAIPWRMCETNSFSGGGRPGVSDTILGALWTLDYMLLLASYGCSGINIETGVNQLGFVSSYSPIKDDGHGLNSFGVPYYGMLAFATAFVGCHEILPVDMDNARSNVTAYSLGSERKPVSLVIVNRDETQDARLSIKELGMGPVSVLRLLCSSPNTPTHVTFGGAAVDAAGCWTPGSHEIIRDGNVTVPKMSAVVLRRAPIESQ